ncbi:DNA circularization protein [Methylobacter tundripaludum]|uniref:DNA circularization protein n=1 Tax=Methylobacter tundripaludum TaxID=173365 RepID=UPI0004DF8AFC|nr:DNA circularization N-terminal domain-containing protein [Methylobacter tundripaludum]
MAEAAPQTWRDKLLPASFRGVPFSYISTDGQVGRRNVVHEFPQRDLPLAEDLGRKAREFTFEACIVGDNYMDGRDRLIAALEAYGSGELVHPYRGRMQVVVSSPARVSESTAEGGMARFSLTFTESGEAVNPAPRTDTAAAVETAADEAQVEAEKGFFDDFNVDGLQDFVPTEALTTINDSLNSVMQAANGLMSGGLLPEFTQQLFSMSSTVSNLIRFPANLAGGLIGQIKSLSGIASNPFSALSSLRSLFSFGSNAKPVPNSVGGAPYINKAGTPIYIGQAGIPAVINPLVTPSRQQQAVNQAAVSTLVQRAAVIEAARVSAQITPASYGEAIVLRDEIADKLEALAETAPDAVYMALTKLRIAVIQDITARAADLSRTVSYAVPTTLPVLVVAYGLYGNIDQFDNIVARNHIRHPGFVPGGRSIEILTP